MQNECDMRKTVKIFAAVAVLFSAVQTLPAQSRSFKLGQWMEIQNSIIRDIARYYVDSIPVDRMYKAGIDKMLENLDPYTVYVPESEQDDFEMMISNSYGGIGAIIYKPDKDGNVIINEPYAGSPAALAGLRCGDEIMEIDGAPVRGLEVGQASSKMKGKPGTDVVFTVKKVRSGEISKVKITRERIHLPNVEYYGMLDDGKTGYIFQTGFTEGTSEEVRKALISLKSQGASRIVLDLRGNGGGLLDEAVKIVSLFVPKGTLVVTSKGTVDGETKYVTSTDPVDTEIPLLVMVDSGSASASEIVSGAVQDLDRGMTAGKRTFGKGLVQKILPVAYNGQLKVTSAKYYTPSGRCVQARDYAHRAEDGSVGNIPDSLTREFRTAGGRIVRDGGGITPDITVDSKPYRRVAYAAVLGGLTNNWPIEYVRTHEDIGPLADFHLSDDDYAAFVEWASDQTFDSRSESETYLDLLVTQMKKDGEYDDVKEQLDAVEQVVKMDKKAALLRSRDQIQPVLEEEIAVRFYFQEAGPQIRLRTDDQLRAALEKWEGSEQVVVNP